MAHRHMHRHVGVAQLEEARRNVMVTVTSIVGGVIEQRAPLTIVKTVYTTQTPSGYTGALKTLAAGEAATEDSTTTPTTTAEEQTSKATVTLKRTTSTSSSTTSSSTKVTATATVKAITTSSSTSETAKTTSATQQKNKTTAVTSASAESETSSIDATTAATSDSVLPVDTRTTDSSTAVAQTTAIVGTPTRVEASSATASADADSTSSSGGSSAGTKAGIAIGVLGGVFIVCLLVYLLFRKRKKQAQRQRLADDEKLHGPYGNHAAAGAAPPLAAQSVSFFDPGSPATKTGTFAPRLSLRPVTQFLPNWIGGGPMVGAAAGAATAGAVGAAAVATQHQTKEQPAGFHPDRRTSRGAAVALQDAAPLAARAPGGSAWERPSTSSGNPFGETAKRVDPFAHPNDSASSLGHSPATSDTSSEEYGSALSSPSPLSISPIAATAASTSAIGAAGAMSYANTSPSTDAAPSSLMRKTSIRKDGPKALDLTLTPPTLGTSLGTIPPSPAGTEFSVNSLASGQNPAPSSSAAAIAAAGGPAISTVHRVQLDFKPTLEDELDLRAGQLVRLLHEYDDGWALCIRLDRSKQGVVPRTCLSTRPVKPRPAPGGGRRGPPINPSGQQGRGPRPGPNGRPGPNSQRGPIPVRPQSPAGVRPGSRPGSRQGGPPNGRPQSPYGARPGSRPQSPAPGGRPQSPGPRYQGRPPSRPQSPSAMNGRRITPPGPSQMNQQQQQQQRRPSAGQSIGRKPVPGQAY